MTTGSVGLLSEMRFVPSNACNRGSYFPGPQLLKTAFCSAVSTGDNATIAPTFRSRLGQPSRRLPIPPVSELSTDEWHNAQVVPTDLRSPPPLTRPITPTTALSSRS